MSYDDLVSGGYLPTYFDILTNLSSGSEHRVTQWLRDQLHQERGSSESHRSIESTGPNIPPGLNLD